MSIKIDRYYGYCFEGRGRIEDRLEGKVIIQFDFPIIDSKLAVKICEKCMDELNNRYEK